MAKQRIQLTFKFVNPNTAKEFEDQFKKILIEKLLSLNHGRRGFLSFERPANALRSSAVRGRSSERSANK